MQLRGPLASFCIAIAAAAAVSGCVANRRTAPPPPSPSPTPTIATVPNPLNGLPAVPQTLKHRVAAVLIDNYPVDARPQSGLRAADLVYEIEAEGGITRYMALYLQNTPKKIGPVRSARLYMVDLARPYEPLFAHAGENDDVWEPLRALRDGGFADMEEILTAGEAFWRDNSRNMPHNLYTSIASLRDAAPKHGWADQTFAGSQFAFLGDPVGDPAHVQAAVPDVDLDFWSGYHVRYVYDDGSYRRLIDGVTQHDLDDPTPYRIADVVAIWIPAQVIDDLGDLRMNVYGRFPAVAVRNGLATTGMWIEAGPDALPRLEDGSGDPMLLTPGQIYVEVLPQGGRLTVGKQSWSY